ncbi:endonuclease III [Candidatus Epulonipiscium fishelsonii]|uniref:Endonuclease III n=1 Tax=Candidatus Epulonipiscium fishelsonii TaxID=77094 RepID=A0ACC8X8B5_9FIRM|nr:endonuclease III [Epulopiscium sp. SCG-B11WGA-EpuloA1]ONI41145.1 endonuclease III [Epulopiscium sp. SCG-B05WGA-EpuloA1]ONI47914.1 endonuclease III [Epulopiscium sp. SCG-C06WGA-EpuloA1]
MIQEILNLLDEVYNTNIKCYLNYESPFQLLVATILSAQCKDDRVNIVTKDLFKKYPTVYDFAKADIQELEQDIRIIGFHRNKAKNILLCANQVIQRHNGDVPSDINLLVELAGVGRKTANVIRGNIFEIPSIVVDTHVKRISIRWGLTSSTDPTAIEKDLMEILPKEHWIRYNTQVIAHGRAICTARSPKCEHCKFLIYCPFGLTKLLERMPDSVKKCIEEGIMY